MDYQVFIVARIADGRRSGLTNDEALVQGLAGAGRVITCINFADEMEISS
jgi:hypothetical protein